jgi:hypothetical protein
MQSVKVVHLEELLRTALDKQYEAEEKIKTAWEQIENLKNPKIDPTVCNIESKIMEKIEFSIDTKRLENVPIGTTGIFRIGYRNEVVVAKLGEFQTFRASNVAFTAKDVSHFALFEFTPPKPNENE